jgi:hypothetical protein
MIAGLGLAWVVLTGAACSEGSRQATEVRTYAPWAPGGELNADVEVGAEVTGSCFSAASRLQRADTFRCTLDAPAADGSTLGDPCFAGPPGRLACVAEPGGEATIVTVTEPLPENDSDGLAGEQAPWAMTLESGETCVFAGGATATVGSERLNYFCDGEVVVYGEPDRGEPVWTVMTARKGSSTLSASEVGLAWF